MGKLKIPRKKSTLIATKSHKIPPKVEPKTPEWKIITWSVVLVFFCSLTFKKIIYDINSTNYNLQLSADLGMDQTCNWRDLVPASHQVFHHTLLMLCLESGLDMIPVQSFQIEYAPTIIHVRNCEDNHHTQLRIENNKTGNECITWNWGAFK